jgi:peptidoglycan/LPS O-acetylase OafA/YrhL
VQGKSTKKVFRLDRRSKGRQSVADRDANNTLAVTRGKGTANRAIPAIDTTRRIPELDGWRAISVLLVIVSHVVSNRYLHALEGVSPLLAQVVFFSGGLGPQVFFVISGFVICRLLIKEEARYGAISLKGFYWRRVFRILPPLLTYLAAVYELLRHGMIDEKRKALVCSALFLYQAKFWLNLPASGWACG